MKISVCMATYNGDKYLREQIDSIIMQLGEDDELIISDDGSVDSTIEIIESYNDSRIKLFFNDTGQHGFVRNFENALSKASGEIIFLADQDDIWFTNKISECKKLIIKNNYDILINNCILTNCDLTQKGKNYFTRKYNPVRKGVVGNLISNCWLGCCMSFTATTLKKVLPFPKGIIAHDYWIGLFGNAKLNCGFYEAPLQYYRRHDSTATPSGSKSSLPILRRLNIRLKIFNALLNKLLLHK